MSWSASTPTIDKNTELKTTEFTSKSPENIDGPMLSQMNDAIEVAKMLVKSIPGPKIQVSLSGHANGVGWSKKVGWSDDCISVNVRQVTE